jgi:hypothetical protein
MRVCVFLLAAIHIGVNEYVVLLDKTAANSNNSAAAAASSPSVRHIRGPTTIYPSPDEEIVLDERTKALVRKCEDVQDDTTIAASGPTYADWSVTAHSVLFRSFSELALCPAITVSRLHKVFVLTRLLASFLSLCFRVLFAVICFFLCVAMCPCVSLCALLPICCLFCSACPPSLQPSSSQLVLSATVWRNDAVGHRIDEGAQSDRCGSSCSSGSKNMFPQ